MLGLDGSNIFQLCLIVFFHGGILERKPWFWSKDQICSQCLTTSFMIFSPKNGTRVILGFHLHVLGGISQPHVAPSSDEQHLPQGAAVYLLLTLN